MTQDEARARVTRGAALLDTQMPGWAGRIDTGTLTLHNPCGCIIGQLCGTDDFELGLKRIGMKGARASRLAGDHGLNLVGCDVIDLHTHNMAAYRLLQECWIEAIADRLLPAAQPSEAVVAVGAL